MVVIIFFKHFAPPMYINIY